MSNPAGLKQWWPLLLVRDLARSLDFYRDRLGFVIANQAQTDERIYWCRLERDGVSLMLQQAEPEDDPPEDRGRGVSLYLVCADVDALHADFAARGLRLDPPQDTYYGMRQLFVPEPDGYAVCFETPI